MSREVNTILATGRKKMKPPGGEGDPEKVGIGARYRVSGVRRLVFRWQAGWRAASIGLP